jgi:hypothetical protein
VAISTYGELKTAIAAQVDRDDLTSQLANFVVLAESDIRKDVRTRDMEAYLTGTLSAETLGFPARFLEARRLVVNDRVQRYVTLDEYQAADTAGSVLDIYTIIGQSFYILNGSDGDTYSLTYWASTAPFSADTDDNWLITNHPEVYLWAGCKYASIFVQASADIERYEALYQAAVGRLMMREKQTSYTGGSLQIRSTARE